MPRSGFGIGDVRLPGGGSVGGFDYKNKDNKITAECGVDIRLVDTTTAKVVAAHFGEFKRVETLSAERFATFSVSQISSLEAA